MVVKDLLDAVYLLISIKARFIDCTSKSYSSLENNHEKKNKMSHLILPSRHQDLSWNNQVGRRRRPHLLIEKVSSELITQQQQHKGHERSASAVAAGTGSSPNWSQIMMK